MSSASLSGASGAGIHPSDGGVTGLAAAKAATWDLHTRAERSGIIADILQGQASRFGVALLLRNLLPSYQILDVSPFGGPALARSDAIESDLRLLWPGAEVPMLAEGVAYAEQVRRAGEADTAGLIAHAYVRYLGDLNGGRILQRRLVDCLGDVAHGLRFHEYPMLDDIPGFTQAYREGLDRAAQAAAFDTVAREARTAFEMNIALSEAVKRFLG